MTNYEMIKNNDFSKQEFRNLLFRISLEGIHYFDDESKENNMNNPGEVYVYIASQVTVRSRETPARPVGDRDEVFWLLRRGPSVHMTYADDGVVMLEYRYTD